MKLSSTVSLAAALAAGIAGAAAAQTTAAPGPAAPPGSQTTATATPQPNWGAAQPQAGSTQQPQANAMAPQGQPGYGQTPATSPQQGSASLQPPPGAQMQANSAPAQANSNETVRQAQQRLHTAGLYNGPVDGVMDPDTRAAIARFQQQNGLRRSESLDEATLAQLNAQPAGFGSSAAGNGELPGKSEGQATAPLGAGGNAGGQTLRR